MSCTCQFKVLPYFISQYLVILLIVLPFAFFNSHSKPSVAEQRKCKKSTSWNDSNTPSYFYHLTDIHISHYIPESWETLRNALKVGLNYESDILFITGDVVDNYHYLKFPSDLIITRQIPEDWINYSTIMNEYANNYSLIIEALGNHDSIQTWSKESNFNYARYSQLSKIRNLTEEYDIILVNSSDFTFLIINPVEFPFSPLPLNYYVDPTQAFLDKLEKTIDSIDPKLNLIVGTHFHLPVWNWKARSSRGHNIIDILNNPKIHLFITGHNHGTSQMIMHHNDLIEVCACDLRFDKMCGIVTEDNEMASFHYVNSTNPTPFFISYPLPIAQTSSRTSCSIPKVRAIVFEDLLPENKTISFYLDSDSSNAQQLHPIREIKPHVWLYSADIIVNQYQNKNQNYSDIHQLTFSNSDKSYEYGFEFVYNENGEGIVPETTEMLYDEFYCYHQREVSLVILVIMILFITFPISVLTFDDYFKWSVNQESTSPEWVQWLLSFTCVCAMRSRIMHLPKSYRILIFSTGILSLILPYFVYEIEGHLCCIFSFGFYSKYLRHEMWCTLSCFTFLSEGFFPILWVLSSLGLSYGNYSFSKIQIVDIVFYLLMVIRNINSAFIPFIMLVGTKYPPYSAFFVMPLLWLVIFIIYFYRLFTKVLIKKTQ